MEGYKEHFLLEELRFLATAALVHAARIEELSRVWTDADTALQPLLQPAPPPEVRRRYDETQRLLGIRSGAQPEIFASIEAFLGFYARMALIIFPKDERQDPVRRRRAERIRSALGVTARHGIATRLLRNKWFHFDEVLDKQMATAGVLLQPARFMTSAELAKSRDTQTIRLLILDRLEVHYRKVGAFKLRDLFEHVRDIDSRAGQAIVTWGTRWPNE